MAVILDGKACSEKVKSQIKNEINHIVSSGKAAPCLAVILVGNNSASQIYVRNKAKACEATGIISRQFVLPEATTESEVISLVNTLNADNDVDGILVQLPLPETIDEKRVIESILPEKDVDGFHPVNVGKVSLGLDGFVSCTPAGIIRLLNEYNINAEKKNCVVIGRSNIVGKPIARLLLKDNGTVTVCHSKTPNLAEYTQKADILIVAVGKAGIVNGDMIKQGAIVVDVGMNRIEGKLYGDCDFDSCFSKASFITPVPGGVGPMTVAMLLQNTLYSYKKKMQL